MDVALPGILFLTLADTNKRLLNSMNHQNGPMLVQLGVSVSHYFVTYFLCYDMGMGVKGPALAFTITTINLFVCTALFTEYVGRKDPKIKEAWFMPSRKTFEVQGLREYLKVGVPSIGMLCFEWWSFEIMILISA